MQRFRFRLVPAIRRFLFFVVVFFFLRKGEKPNRLIACYYECGAG